ncbi:hypothetical protein EWM64_g650 [Hericium alpestre]|uniref:Glucose-methanol-choline oxidoreductase N-terminal domain-containing protein n=1 Tax=Hericium alpestre TaxID=135208 RepID=A0A4Z0A9H3_9AGAM|nr:hypothetical protein EWM64_g650 [Hericium alpestre]
MYAPSVPPDIAVYTGPLALGFLFNVGLFGALSVQVCRCFGRETYHADGLTFSKDIYHLCFVKDQWKIRAVVYCTYIWELLQTILIIRDAYVILGSGWGDLAKPLAPELLWFSVPIQTGFGTGVLTACISAVDCVLFITFQDNNLHVAPALALGKLYSNSLMVLLNNRLRTQPANMSSIRWDEQSPEQYSGGDVVLDRRRLTAGARRMDQNGLVNAEPRGVTVRVDVQTEDHPELELDNMTKQASSTASDADHGAARSVQWRSLCDSAQHLEESLRHAHSGDWIIQHNGAHVSPELIIRSILSSSARLVCIRRSIIMVLNAPSEAPLPPKHDLRFFLSWPSLEAGDLSLQTHIKDTDAQACIVSSRETSSIIMPLCSEADFTQITFDYVIIGAGNAGLPLAVRLSEDPNVTVGVLEAGDNHLDSPDIQCPGLVLKNVANPKYDWTFFSTPQKNANNRSIIQPRGKGLGGSSLLNFLINSRPSKADFDALSALGNEGWDWETVLQYTKKSETLVPLVDDALAQSYSLPDAELHGISGPIKKTYPSWCDPFHFSIIKSLEALGVPWNKEPGGGINVGSSTGLTNVDPASATRSYAASDYYAPHAARQNLYILTGALVSKIVFEDAEDGLKKAVGVDFVHQGTLLTIRGIRKEVIVSAGAMQTPALLELSGIGNPQILAKHDFPSLIDLPGVGENFQDHVLTFCIYEANPKLQTLDVLGDPTVLEEQIELYKEKKGLMAGSVVHTFSYLPASAFVPPEEIKRWQDDQGEAGQAASPGLKKQHDLIRSWFSDSQETTAEIMFLPGHFVCPDPLPQPGKRYMSLAISVTHPLSRGSVHITSSNPSDLPAIDPNYFGNPVDLEILVNAQDILGHVLPAKNASDAELREHVKNTCGPAFHPLGTAAMLPREDGGVVDSKLKVYGTSNLRVVDCSILPMEISCHIQSTAYALAEKAADIIKAA